MTTEKRSTPWAAHPAALLLGAALLSGFATGPNANPADPLEPYNRSMSTFNENVDKAVLKPVATAYRDVTPQPLRTGVTNFFANLGDAWSFANNLLQLRGREAFDSMVRFSVNSVLGLGGVLDIASEMG
ncbi:MAG: VacJ family lipoprotein, partial [Alicycliphilus sp.]|nr:VacJ family lipoprotein [Alicycliphilus sp.]